MYDNRTARAKANLDYRYAEPTQTFPRVGGLNPHALRLLLCPHPQHKPSQRPPTQTDTNDFFSARAERVGLSYGGHGEAPDPRRSRAPSLAELGSDFHRVRSAGAELLSNRESQVRVTDQPVKIFSL